MNLQEGINNVTINNKKILPNRRYKLRLEIKGKSELDYSKEISFKISQSYPDSIKNISLVCKDTLKDTDSLYDLSITKPDNLGYWGKNSCGYEKQLIINSKCVSTIQISGTQNIKDTSFSIEQDFGYKPKVDDTIQIGFRVWVTDDAGVKWYDDDMPKTSESICLLNRPVITCLNTIS